MQSNQLFDLEGQRKKKTLEEFDAYSQMSDENEVLGQRTSFQADLRSNFIKKVYTILTAQLIFTVLMASISMTSHSFLMFQLTNPGLLYFFIFLSIAIMLILMCIPSAAKKVPLNYILLFVFTFAEGYMVSFFCGTSKGKIVLMAAVATLGIVCALTYYAMTTKSDFTLQGGLLSL